TPVTVIGICATYTPAAVLPVMTGGAAIVMLTPELTQRRTIDVWLVAPLVAVTVTRLLPEAAPLSAVKVRMVLPPPVMVGGLKVPVTFGGRPETLIVTVPPKFKSGEIWKS